MQNKELFNEFCYLNSTDLFKSGFFEDNSTDRRIKHIDYDYIENTAFFLKICLPKKGKMPTKFAKHASNFGSNITKIVVTRLWRAIGICSGRSARCIAGCTTGGYVDKQD